MKNTPRQSLGRALDENNREVNVGHRHRSLEDVLKRSEKRAEDLLHEKHEVQHERDDLRTQLHLSRQRELKLQATIEKHEATLARYKERSVKFAETQAQHDAQQRTLEGSKAAARMDLRHMQQVADENAARCAALTKENDALRARLAERTQAAAEDDEEQALLAERNARAVARAAGATLVSARREHARTLAEVRGRLADALHAASHAGRSHGAHVDALLEELEARAAERDQLLADADAAHAELLRLRAYCAELEQAAEQRPDPVEHALVLAALDGERLEAYTLRRTLEDTQYMAATLREDLAAVVTELDRVAWYEEAYEARSKQVSLLTAIVRLAEEKPRRASMPTALADARAELASIEMPPPRACRSAELPSTARFGPVPPALLRTPSDILYWTGLGTASRSSLLSTSPVMPTSPPARATPNGVDGLGIEHMELPDPALDAEVQ